MTKDDITAEITQQPTTDKRPKLRLIPIWLRLLIVLALVAVAAIIGAMVGYAGLGEGKAFDVFTPEVWRHILDIMNGKIDK